MGRDVYRSKAAYISISPNLVKVRLILGGGGAVVI